VAPLDRLLRRRHIAGTRSRWDRVAGRPVHARVASGGEGAPVVVLLHGFGVSSRYLMPTAARLPPGLTAMAPDLPGTGLSPRRGLGTDMASLVDTVAEWIDVVGLRAPALVANSFGCQVALHLAARHPGSAGPMVLVGPTVDRHARSLPGQVAGLLRTAVHERPGLLALIATEYPAFVLRGGLRVAETALDDAVEAVLPRVAQPVLVVRGEHDGLVSRRWAREVAGGLPRGALREVPGAAHALNYSHPRALEGLVRGFLRAQGVGEGP